MAFGFGKHWHLLVVGLTIDSVSSARVTRRANATWSFLSPITYGVHEYMSFRAFTAAGFGGDMPQGPSSGNACPPASVAEILRGNLFNDDTAGLNFNDDGSSEGCPDGYIMTLAGGARFGATFSLVNKDDCSIHGFAEALLCESHYGSAQFLHSMASSAGESAEATKANLIKYFEFAYSVAIGAIPEDAKVLDAVHSSLRPIFSAAKLTDSSTVKDLYVMTPDGKPFSAPWVNVKQRALGSVLHMIQDSFSEGHTIRWAGSGDVLQFPAYNLQDGATHRIYDSLPDEGSDRNAGVEQAVALSTKLVNFYKNGVAWTSGVGNWASNEAFKLSSTAVAAGSGQTTMTVIFETAKCSWYENCGTFNDALVSFCYDSGFCTDDFSTCGATCPGFFRNTTETKKVKMPDMGCITSFRLRKSGSDNWNLARVSVEGGSSVCRTSGFSKAWEVGWIDDNKKRTFS